MSQVGLTVQTLPGVNPPAPEDVGLVAVVNEASDNWSYIDVTTLETGDEIAVVFAPFIASDTLRAQTVSEKLEIFPGHTRTVEIEERFLTRETNLVVGTLGGVVGNTTGAVTQVLHDDSDLLTKMRFEDTDGTGCVYQLGLIGFTSRMMKSQTLVSLEFVVRIPPDANSTHIFGFGRRTDARTAHFKHDNPGSGGTYQNWFIEHDDGTTITSTDTGVLATSSAVNLQIVRSGSNFVYFIDGTQVSSQSYATTAHGPICMSVEQLAGTPSEASEFEASLLRFRAALGTNYACLPNTVDLLE